MAAGLRNAYPGAARVRYHAAAMVATRRLIVSFVILSACEGKPADSTAKAESPTKAATKAEPTKREAKGGDGKAATKPADPHASLGTPPPAPTKPKGPPRDITPTGKTAEQTTDELIWPAPQEWEAQPSSSAMRKAQYIVPGPGGDGELVVFRFPGGAGGVEANVARWKGQFKVPEGKTAADLGTTRTFEAGTLKVTWVDITGHYAAPAQPGSTTMVEEPDSRMIAAIVEGSGDPLFFKLFGPTKTIDLWAKAFEDDLKAAKIAAK